MSSLIASKVKTNMCFVSIKLFIVHTTFVPLFTLNWYNISYNNNLLSSLFLAHNYSLFCFKHANATQYWLITTYFLIALPCYFIVQRSWNRRFLFLYVYSHTCHSLMLIVVGLGVRCICWCVSVYPLPFAYVAFVLSISLRLILMLL